MNKIRLGMINCDLHGLYYAALIENYDPFALRDDVGLIRGGPATYFYFYMKYNEPKSMTVPKVEGFKITKVWDKNPKLSETLSRLFDSKPLVCNTFEEVSDDVDLVLIADCMGYGEDHLELSSPGIKKGVPTFIDKPLAFEYKDAKKIIDLAEEYGTPVMSLSMLRTLPHALRFRKRFEEIGTPEFGTIIGGGEGMDGHIHAISLAQHLFGPGVESVECMGQTQLAYVHLNYVENPDRPKDGVTLNCASGGRFHCSMYASAYSKLGAVHSPAFGDFEFPYGAAEIMEMIKKMVQTGKPQAPYEEMVECIAVATAARIAQKSGKTVCLKDVY